MKRVAVSLGHNPDAPGASRLFEEESEYTFLAPLFGYLIQALQRRRILAYIVPTGKLSKKVAFINEGNFDFAIELHLNADPDDDSPGDPVAVGCETLYFKGSTKGKVFADSIQKKVVENFAVSDRGAVERDNLAFLRDTNCPAVILEPGFIDELSSIGDPGELDFILSNPKYLADLISSAIEEVLLAS